MRSIPRITFASAVLAGFLLVSELHGAPTGNAGKEMSEAAVAFLASLSADQRATASFAFGDEERLDWHFIPRQRRGLSFGDMDEGQRELVWGLLDTGLSAQGIRKVDDIIALELVLRELGGNPAVRNPELYFVSITDLRPEQVDQLVRLMDEYLERMSNDLAASRRARIEASGLDHITFAWAGSLEAGKPHYYRIQGPSFLVEYDNTQNNANHIHSVWRDFNGDFGRDLLREHYEGHPHRN